MRLLIELCLLAVVTEICNCNQMKCKNVHHFGEKEKKHRRGAKTH